MKKARNYVSLRKKPFMSLQKPTPTTHRPPPKKTLQKEFMRKTYAEKWRLGGMKGLKGCERGALIGELHT